MYLIGVDDHPSFQTIAFRPSELCPFSYGALPCNVSASSLRGRTRGAVVKIFLLGATGNSGRRILRLALQRAHEVTTFVRDETKLLNLVDRPIRPNLHVSISNINKSANITRMMTGHDVAINATDTMTKG